MTGFIQDITQHPMQYVLVLSIILVATYLVHIIKRKKPMPTESMQRIQTEREAVERDYHEWMLQADIYFDAQDYSGAFGAASMAAAKAQRLNELKKMG